MIARHITFHFIYFTKIFFIYMSFMLVSARSITNRTIAIRSFRNDPFSVHTPSTRLRLEAANATKT